jgi:hypothetical protein
MNQEHRFTGLKVFFGSAPWRGAICTLLDKRRCKDPQLAAGAGDKGMGSGLIRS